MKLPTGEQILKKQIDILSALAADLQEDLRLSAAEVERLEFINKKLLEDTPAVAKLQEAEEENKVLREVLERIEDLPDKQGLGVMTHRDGLTLPNLVWNMKYIAEQALKETAMNKNPNDHNTDLLEYLDSKGTPEQLAEAFEQAEEGRHEIRNNNT